MRMKNHESLAPKPPQEQQIETLLNPQRNNPQEDGRRKETEERSDKKGKSERTLHYQGI